MKAVFVFFGCLCIVLVLTCAYFAKSYGYSRGVTDGRIDVASGRVKATQVVNGDGLTEWKFERAADSKH